MPRIKTQLKDMELKDLNKPETLIVYNKEAEAFSFETLGYENFIEERDVRNRKTRTVKTNSAKECKLTFDTGRSAGTQLTVYTSENTKFLVYQPTAKELLERSERPLSLETVVDPFKKVENYKEVLAKDLNAGDFVMKYVSFNNRAKPMSVRLSAKESGEIKDYVEIKSIADNFLVVDNFLIKY